MDHTEEEKFTLFPMEIVQNFKETDQDQANFASKVFGIVAFQLLISLIFCLISFTEKGSQFYLSHYYLAIFMMTETFCTMLPLACSKNLARSVPINYILLISFTTGEAYLFGLFCAYFTIHSVIYALIISTAIVSILGIYAFTTKNDYTPWNAGLVVFLVAFISFTLCLTFVKIPFLNMLYSTVGSILFGLYLVVDLQMLFKSEEPHYDMDDYIIAAMNIYLDVLNIIIYLINLIGKRRN